MGLSSRARTYSPQLFFDGGSLTDLSFTEQRYPFSDHPHIRTCRHSGFEDVEIAGQPCVRPSCVATVRQLPLEPER